MQDDNYNNMPSPIYGDEPREAPSPARQGYGAVALGVQDKLDALRQRAGGNRQPAIPAVLQRLELAAPATTAEREEAEAREAKEEEARERVLVLETLKTDINTFLWSRLPRVVTMGDAEKIACRWHEELRALWDPEAIF